MISRWSIGDSKSLVESGPFHSQGRGGVRTVIVIVVVIVIVIVIVIGSVIVIVIIIITSLNLFLHYQVSNQPWQGSWRSNVTVQLTRLEL